MDRSRFRPEVVCLKELGPLGELLAGELPVHSRLLSHKYDLRVFARLRKLMRRPQAHAVVTVGAGDKMFWGRLAARAAGVPVVVSALHSTGWPDGVGRLNRLLTPWTDAFIGVADAHAEHLKHNEGFPAPKVHTIYNGVDCMRFAPRDATPVRRELGVDDDAPVIGILAALRPEKNHEMFLAGARLIRIQAPRARFLIIGDGPRRAELESLAREMALDDCVCFLGSRSDVPRVLAACDVVALTSHNEAAPVSILEALSTGVPVVAAAVGSVKEPVVDGETGRLFPAGDVAAFASRTLELVEDPQARRRMGLEGRRRVRKRWSVEAMVRGYEQLIEQLYAEKQFRRRGPAPLVQRFGDRRLSAAPVAPPG
jgi:glycosyltransferase involved in cell wall biosynthesis